VSGDAIESVWLGSKPQTMKSPPAEIAATLEQTRITQVRRMGKHIVFDLERNGTVRKERAAKRKNGAAVLGSRSQWIVHLGMTGRMVVCDPDAEVAKHTHAVVKLASGRELRFVDPRRFGRLSVASQADFEAGGVEPLEVDRESFVALFRGRKTPIKSALLNQKLLRGVGNIYADESLFRAGLRPRRRASTITSAQLQKLHASVQKVLKEAIKAGGSSISDYVDADGEEGFFQLRHRVYGREEEPCLVCKTPIKRIVIVGRSSHYCPKCQK
jgi:formamidopyrimidine-DNA glycosylase